jgi:hypothetical protein
MGRKEAVRNAVILVPEAGRFRGPKKQPENAAEKPARNKGWRKHAGELEAYVKRHAPDAISESEDADITDLPPALLRELRSQHANLLDAQIIAVLKDHSGSANLDEILIGLYRKFQIIQKRRFVQNKIWRMVRKGQLHQMKPARGVFGIVRPRQQR